MILHTSSYVPKTLTITVEFTTILLKPSRPHILSLFSLFALVLRTPFPPSSPPLCVTLRESACVCVCASAIYSFSPSHALILFSPHYAHIALCITFSLLLTDNLLWRFLHSSTSSSSSPFHHPCTSFRGRPPTSCLPRRTSTVVDFKTGKEKEDEII